MEMVLHSQANKTHVCKKGCALSHVLKLMVFGTLKWPIGHMVELTFEFAVSVILNLSASRHDRATTVKKCTKKRDERAKLLFC